MGSCMQVLLLFAAHFDQTLLAYVHVHLFPAALHKDAGMAMLAQVSMHVAQHGGPLIHSGSSAAMGQGLTHWSLQPCNLLFPLCSHTTALRTHLAVLTIWQQPSVVV